METIKINCPNCNLTIEYWTKNNYINCPQCNEIIKVELCKDEEIQEEPTEIEEDV